MCGICGIVSPTPRQPGSTSIIRRMNDDLRHRGPDQTGYFSDDYAQLASRRLSIIDLETGQQPISNETNTLHIVHNGEIYNFRELNGQLGSYGHKFSTKSDTETILHAYEQYGDGCVDHLNGMFAFAVWDAPRRRLFLARDRLGIKPLYYWTTPSILVFASELTALLAHPDVPRAIDPIALDQFLTLEYIPSPRTILREVCKLPPGHHLVYEDGHVRVEPYWDIPYHQEPEHKEPPAEHLTELIRDAVRLRLVSDVPLGALLSGGIDSSTVVAAMHEVTTNPIHTYSIGFEDATYDELPYARTVAAHFNTQFHEEILQPEIAPLAEQLIGHLDEPLADFSIFPTYLVSKMARQFVKVVLSGDGGDELFGGYDTYIAQDVDRFYRRLPPALRKKYLPDLLARIPPQPAKKGMINKTKRFVEGAALPPDLQHARWMMFLSPGDKDALFHPAFSAELAALRTESVFDNYFRTVDKAPPLIQQQYVDLKTYLPDNILTKVDRMSMAVSLEARVPLLDHRIVEFALNLPPKLKVRRGRTKLILREAMKDRLPPGVLHKPKQGFSIPLKHWLRGPLRPLMLDLLSENRIRRRNYFNPETVKWWIARHLEQRANHSHQLWALMVFELWLEKHL